MEVGLQNGGAFVLRWSLDILKMFAENMWGSYFEAVVLMH